MVSLTILDTLPPGFLTTRAPDLHRVVGGLTLIELAGTNRLPLFVSCLLHGNEDSGLDAVQQVLRARALAPLPRSMVLMIGNVDAARHGRRRLDGQPDYNRVWPGVIEQRNTPEAAVMAQIHARVVERGAFAAIDLHNNTGRNPHYGVVCSDDPCVLGLAAMFAPRAVRFRGIPGTQTASFSGLIPAMTAECGQPGVPENADAAARLIDGVLDLHELPQGPDSNQTLDLYHTLGTVRVKPDVALGALATGQGLCLADDLDARNFRLVAAGTVIGRTAHPMPLEVIDDSGRDVAHEHFIVERGELRLRRAEIPAMLTNDERIIRQDCLGYLMARL